MESVRITDGSEGVFKLYWEAGARVHHDKAEVFDPVEALGAVGLDTSHGDTFNDESWTRPVPKTCPIGWLRPVAPEVATRADVSRGVR
jgi:hypothetical protein